MAEPIEIDTGHDRSQDSLKDTDAQMESRKRISNIIIVDLTKDKKAKYPDRPKVIATYTFPYIETKWVMYCVTL